jgi:hypothetical protein
MAFWSFLKTHAKVPKMSIHVRAQKFEKKRKRSKQQKKILSDTFLCFCYGVRMATVCLQFFFHISQKKSPLHKTA